MASSSNKKLSILYILEILKKYSDENHLLTQAEIINKLYSIYGMECERKSISSNIDLLIDFGYDIIKQSNGCYLASREFETSEIQFLIDAIFSSKSINSNHSKQLADKLSSFLSSHQKKQYNYIYKADDINRTNNKQLFYTIDIINEAISQNKKIKFNYKRFYLDENKNNKKKYLINPYFLVNKQGSYYLVCNYDYFNKIANYKVDRIENIEITDEPIKPIKELEGCENGIDIAKYTNENIYMFSNDTINATIKIADEYSVNYVNEWFGKNAKFYKQNEEIYADLKVNEQALIYWSLQYGESVEIIEPLQTREKIKNIISSMLEKYLK